MKIARFQKDSVTYAAIVEGEILKVIKDNFLEEIVETGEIFNLSDVTLLSPTMPSKVLCVGINYMSHIEEMGAKVPTSPVIFMKPSETVVGHMADVIYPTEMVKRLDFEAELAIVIGKKAKNVSVENADEYIFGYTCGNDITARDLQPHDGQWTISKGFDTFMPLGPVIDTEVNGNNLKIETTVNGEVKQSSTTADLCFNTQFLVSYLSKIFTLNAGDVIITGTPSGIAPMQIGDSVSVTIEGIGTLTNTIK